MSNFSRPAEDLSREAKEYIDLRLEDVKLRTAKGLSVTASKLVGLFLILGVGLYCVREIVNCIALLSIKNDIKIVSCCGSFCNL